jgi:RecA/RadA recombinase
MSPIGEQETKKHVEKSLADDTMALIAKKLSQFFRMSSFQVWESDCTFVLIGQTRTELGGFIALEKLSGGHALEHWAALTVHVRRGAKEGWPHTMVKDEGEEKAHKVYTGFSMVARIDKSKVGPDEGKESLIKFMYGKGLEND